MVCASISFADSNIEGATGVMGDVIESTCTLGYLNQFSKRQQSVICDYTGVWAPHITCKRTYGVPSLVSGAHPNKNLKIKFI